ncbi:hypothetical protein FOL47_000051 [Perkinsus chesapeaki]|uniref:Uncharacterized protein n=1 Tax=Perkinsus chesapeaki TaxID=330153 RepID=A0A7J6N317_PERCH|nr:hypothetical protein FOL47_000051 [Perkinsus chesapeaki]
MSERIRLREPASHSPAAASSPYSPSPKLLRESSPQQEGGQENSMVWGNRGDEGGGGESLSYDFLEAYWPSPEGSSGVGGKCVAKAVEDLGERESLDANSGQEVGEEELDGEEGDLEGHEGEAGSGKEEEDGREESDNEGVSLGRDGVVIGSGEGGYKEGLDSHEGSKEGLRQVDEEEEEAYFEDAEEGTVVDGGEVEGNCREDEEPGKVVVLEGAEEEEEDDMHVTVSCIDIFPEEQSEDGSAAAVEQSDPPVKDGPEVAFPTSPAEARVLLERLTEEGSDLEVSTTFLRTLIDEFITDLPSEVCSSVTEIRTFKTVQEMAGVVRHTLRELQRQREGVPPTFDILKAEVELSDELRRMCTFIQTDDGLAEEEQLTLDHWYRFRGLSIPSVCRGLAKSGRLKKLVQVTCRHVRELSKEQWMELCLGLRIDQGNLEEVQEVLVPWVKHFVIPYVGHLSGGLGTVSAIAEHFKALVDWATAVALDNAVDDTAGYAFAVDLLGGVAWSVRKALALPDPNVPLTRTPLHWAALGHLRGLMDKSTFLDEADGLLKRLKLCLEVRESFGVPVNLTDIPEDSRQRGEWFTRAGLELLKRIPTEQIGSIVEDSLYPLAKRMDLDCPLEEAVTNILARYAARDLAEDSVNQTTPADFARVMAVYVCMRTDSSRARILPHLVWIAVRCASSNRGRSSELEEAERICEEAEVWDLDPEDRAGVAANKMRILLHKEARPHLPDETGSVAPDALDAMLPTPQVVFLTVTHLATLEDDEAFRAALRVSDECRRAREGDGPRDKQPQLLARFGKCICPSEVLCTRLMSVVENVIQGGVAEGHVDMLEGITRAAAVFQDTLPFEAQLPGLRSFMTMMWYKSSEPSLNLPVYCTAGIMAAKMAQTEGPDAVIQQRGRCFRRCECLLEEFGIEVLPKDLWYSTSDESHEADLDDVEEDQAGSGLQPAGLFARRKLQRLFTEVVNTGDGYAPKPSGSCCQYSRLAELLGISRQVASYTIARANNSSSSPAGSDAGSLERLLMDNNGGRSSMKALQYIEGQLEERLLPMVEHEDFSHVERPMVQELAGLARLVAKLASQCDVTMLEELLDIGRRLQLATRLVDASDAVPKDINMLRYKASTGALLYSIMKWCSSPSSLMPAVKTFRSAVEVSCGLELDEEDSADSTEKDDECVDGGFLLLGHTCLGRHLLSFFADILASQNWSIAAEVGNCRRLDVLAEWLRRITTTAGERDALLMLFLGLSLPTVIAEETFDKAITERRASGQASLASFLAGTASWLPLLRQFIAEDPIDASRLAPPPPSCTDITLADTTAIDHQQQQRISEGVIVKAFENDAYMLFAKKCLQDRWAIFCTELSVEVDPVLLGEGKAEYLWPLISRLAAAGADLEPLQLLANDFQLPQWEASLAWCTVVIQKPLPSYMGKAWSEIDRLLVSYSGETLRVLECDILGEVEDLDVIEKALERLPEAPFGAHRFAAKTIRDYEHLTGTTGGLTVRRVVEDPQSALMAELMDRQLATLDAILEVIGSDSIAGFVSDASEYILHHAERQSNGVLTLVYGDGSTDTDACLKVENRLTAEPDRWTIAITDELLKLVGRLTDMPARAAEILKALSGMLPVCVDKLRVWQQMKALEKSGAPRQVSSAEINALETRILLRGYPKFASFERVLVELGPWACAEAIGYTGLVEDSTADEAYELLTEVLSLNRVKLGVTMRELADKWVKTPSKKEPWMKLINLERAEAPVCGVDIFDRGEVDREDIQRVVNLLSRYRQATDLAKVMVMLTIFFECGPTSTPASRSRAGDIVLRISDISDIESGYNHEVDFLAPIRSFYAYVDAAGRVLGDSVIRALPTSDATFAESNKKQIAKSVLTVRSVHAAEFTAALLVDYPEDVGLDSETCALVTEVLRLLPKGTAVEVLRKLIASGQLAALPYNRDLNIILVDLALKNSKSSVGPLVRACVPWAEAED